MSNWFDPISRAEVLKLLDLELLLDLRTSYLDLSPPSWLEKESPDQIIDKLCAQLEGMLRTAPGGSLLRMKLEEVERALRAEEKSCLERLEEARAVTEQLARAAAYPSAQSYWLAQRIRVMQEAARQKEKPAQLPSAIPEDPLLSPPSTAQENEQVTVSEQNVAVNSTAPTATDNAQQQKARGKTKGKHIDERMLAAIRDNPAALFWSSAQWAENLQCSKSTIVESKSWIETCRPKREAERLASGKRLRRKTH
jgi:hypothetical protein